MPQIKYTDRAIQDLERFAEFYQRVAPHKTEEVLKAVWNGIDTLKNQPFVGTETPCIELPDLRKLTITYGKKGYVALYQYDKKADLVLIETVRHMLELEPDFLRNH